MKKRKAKQTDTPQKAKRKVVIMLESDVALKIKMEAFEHGQTMTRYLSDVITRAMKG